MKSKIKNLLALAVSGLMFSSCSVFAMKQGIPTGYKNIFIGLIINLDTPYVAPGPDTFKYKDVFDDYVNDINGLANNAIIVKSPAKKYLPEGMSVDDANALVAMSCPGKTITFR